MHPRQGARRGVSPRFRLSLFLSDTPNSSNIPTLVHAPSIANSPTPSSLAPNDVPAPVPVVMPGSITPTRMERDHGHIHSHAHSRQGLDPKRRQTLQSLLDALLELQGDDEAYGTCLVTGGTVFFIFIIIISISCFFALRFC